MNWSSFRKDVETALKEVNKKYNVEMSTKNISYDDKSFRFSVEGIMMEEGKSAEQISFENECRKFILEPSDYGKIVKLDGDDYKIVGIHSRAKKYPIILEKIKDGSKIKITINLLHEIRGK